MIDLRLAYHDSLDVRGPVTYCATQGCGQPTRGAKPHCSDHVLAHPYAARVSRAWDARLSAAKGGALSPELIADARQAVQELGTITTVRLARVLDVDAETVERVSQLLMRDGARPGRTRRGATTLTAPTRWGEQNRARYKRGRKLGRKPGRWLHVTLGEVTRWIDRRRHKGGPNGHTGGATQLAELIGVTPAAVSLWRRGKCVPCEHLQLAIAAVVRADQASGAA